MNNNILILIMIITTAIFAFAIYKISTNMKCQISTGTGLTGSRS